MPDYLFRGTLSDLDPDLDELSKLEAERQFRKLILIPSESTAPMAVREALASPFQNIYAEGYPSKAMLGLMEDELHDCEIILAHYRRYSDRRYYKGVEYVNIIEALTQRRAAAAFAANGISAEGIFVNVQPLSGAPANNAVYHALVKPGETVMGMNLMHGGHLTHGSPVNRSGKLYNIVSYGVDKESEKIDFEHVMQLAEQHQPKMIIAGFSSYPWCVKWEKFREIADSCGAILLADIAHVAGLIATGEYPSPVGIADVITLTTHKSLCGPRGGAILTTSPRLSRLIDRAVFPGEQGGPHINNMMAQAVAFKLARTDQFKQLQVQIKANCVALTDALASSGLRIPYGGTDTHMANIDVSTIRGKDGSHLSGDQAARILDLAGIVMNRNTIPGDTSALNPSGLRFGTPWITQRGFREDECVQLAGLISRILHACRPFSIAKRRGRAMRSKIDFDVLNETRMQTRDLAQSLGIDYVASTSGYPHFYYLDDKQPATPFAIIEIEGVRAADYMRWLTKVRSDRMEPGSRVHTTLMLPDRSTKVILQLDKKSDGWSIMLPSDDFPVVIMWLRDLSDGFVVFDPEDDQRKFPGPIVVRLKGGLDKLPDGAIEAQVNEKPWYLGMREQSAEALPEFAWSAEPARDLRRTNLHQTHLDLGAKMVHFAGWDMPVWYSSVWEEHKVTRTKAGLFDVSHMGVYQVEGSSACRFLDSVTTNDIASLEMGESLYAQFLDPSAAVLDDLMVYRRANESYLVVANASNDDRNWEWLNAVREGKVRVENRQPSAHAFGLDCQLRNLRDPEEGADMRVDLAIQGPMSRDILIALGSDPTTLEQLRRLKWAGVMEGVFGGINLVLSRTGYTGERVAYELFVHPKDSTDLWNLLLEIGDPFGLKPIGLGARDSLRTEAGLPLYGQEMAGEMKLGVGDAGFASFVKTYKPWFIGRHAFLQQEKKREAQVARFRFNDKGVRMAHYGDPVVNRRGQVIGKVTSCAVDLDGYLLGQAYLKKKYSAQGTAIGVFQSASDRGGKAPATLAVGDRVSIPTPATILSRFP